MRRIFASLILVLIMLIMPGCGEKEAVQLQKNNNGQVSEQVVLSHGNENEDLSTNDQINGQINPIDSGDGEDLTEIQDDELPINDPKNVVVNSHVDNDGQIKLILSKNYGSEQLLEQYIEARENLSIMDGLYSLDLDIETAYGGSYVNGIGDLHADNGGFSGERQDWFYYINGIFADMGAFDYYPEEGEVIWWDYHSWKMSKGVPAVIGCYPEPFLHGYDGKVTATTIMYFSDDVELAVELQDALKSKGAKDIKLSKIDTTDTTDTTDVTGTIDIMNVADTINVYDTQKLSKRKGSVILIGEWDKLKKIPYMKELNEAGIRAGLFIHFTDDSVELFDYSGEKVKQISEKAGVITATGEGNGDDSPLWFITGTDRDGLVEAVQVLADNPEKIVGSFSVAIHNSEIIKLPYME
ncbi:MAG: DUF4430 domain-containing protein [Clostridia bacterium]|nr:DUF4430 domain-containing protein [Clostridia bacterium]